MIRRTLCWGLTVVLAGVLAACGLFSSTGADEAARAFGAAFGDPAKAARMTDAPKTAEAALRQAKQALAPEKVRVSVGEVTESDGVATADYTVTWQLPHDRTWSYRTKVELVPHDDSWQVRWTPSALHPKLAAQQTLAMESETPELAPVLDRDGAKLLEPGQVVSVMLYPAEAKQAGGVQRVARSLAASLRTFDRSITADSIVAEARKATGKNDSTLVAVLREGDYQSVKAAIYDLPGVKFARQTRLLTPTKDFGSQVLPAVRSMVTERIAGEAGWRVIAKDSLGAEVAELHRVEPKHGAAVKTTLSRKVLTAAEKAVDDVRKPAALVALQPSTGDILAVAQNEAADKQGAISLTGRYPPGSTFKIATALAALRAKEVTPRSKVDCPGTTVIGGRLVPNEKRFQLGTVPLSRAFAKSCNTTFARLAARMPANALTDAARDLGIGADFVIPGLTTITGSAPPSGSLVQRAENGFGQGKVLASPFGMALAAATVREGRTPVPSLMDGDKVKATGLGKPLAAKDAAALRDMMRRVVTEGTATALRGMGPVHGKTGTAQFGDGKHSHGWFAGYRGDLAFAVLVVGGESSQPAVEVSKAFLGGL